MDPDVLRILVASDTHVGFLERDGQRGDDSFRAFEEILSIASQREVDMILFGGDLFDSSQPSPRTLVRVTSLLEKYCLGDKAIQFQLLSDPSINFPRRKQVNFEDPNVNVSVPFFSIHGNHDDRVGEEQVSALDILAAGNLINYFGSVESVDSFQSSPLLLQKGRTSVAIYGLGFVRDERLHRAFLNDAVQFLQPVNGAGNWFNILCLHQNRAQRGRGATNFVSESFIPSFFNLVVWGHEHDCKLFHDDSASRCILQPGAPVHTQLTPEEAMPKQVAVLEVCFVPQESSTSQKFKITPIPLTSVRPFLFREIELAKDAPLARTPDRVENYLVQVVNSLLAQNEQEVEPPLTPKIPLVRLKVEYTGFSTCNPQRFGQIFIGRVANPSEMLVFHRRRRVERTPGVLGETSHIKVDVHPNGTDFSDLDSMVSENLAHQLPLIVFPETLMREAVADFVQKEDKHAIERALSKRLEQVTQFLSRSRPLNIEEAVARNTSALCTEDAPRGNKRKDVPRSGDRLPVPFSDPKRPRTATGSSRPVVAGAGMLATPAVSDRRGDPSPPHGVMADNFRAKFPGSEGGKSRASSGVPKSKPDRRKYTLKKNQ